MQKTVDAMSTGGIAAGAVAGIQTGLAIAQSASKTARAAANTAAAIGRNAPSAVVPNPRNSATAQSPTVHSPTGGIFSCGFTLPDVSEYEGMSLWQIISYTFSSNNEFLLSMGAIAFADGPEPGPADAVSAIGAVGSSFLFLVWAIHIYETVALEERKPTIFVDPLPDLHLPSIEIFPKGGNEKGLDLLPEPLPQEGQGLHTTPPMIPEENGVQIYTSENTSENIIFGGVVKDSGKLQREMERRGWTEDEIKDLVDNPYTTRESTVKANGDSATVYYNEDGSYVVVDDITHEVIQVSGDRDNPSLWQPDNTIVDPYTPWSN